MKISNCKTSKGFTLIELLVSMIITTIIVMVLVTVTVTSLDIWNRNRSEVRASLQAKAMVDSMAADFESMVVRRGNDYQWLFAEFAPPADGPNSNQSPSALNLIFFSAATDRYDGQVGDPVADLGGDISSIGYQLIYKDPISELTADKYKTFVLYRKLVNPDDTFKDLLGQADLKAAFAPYAQGGAEPLDAVENFICENVYQFTVKFHIDVTVPDPADATKTITKHVSVSLNASEEFIVTGNGLTSPAVSTLSPAELATGRLTAVEVSLSVITDGALRQLRGRNFTDEEKLSDFIAENSYQYSKLIPVPSY
jgi:prepilin-type N-terminal cleavage/methylation domain-containing protein